MCGIFLRLIHQISFDVPSTERELAKKLLESLSMSQDPHWSIQCYAGLFGAIHHKSDRLNYFLSDQRASLSESKSDNSAKFLSDKSPFH